MKTIVLLWLERLIAVIMMVCIASGIILMMCESDDTRTQIATLFGGFSLFVLGTLPGVIISAIERRKEREVNGELYERGY